MMPIEATPSRVEGFIGGRGQAAVVERAEGADELVVLVIATPDQTGGEREENRVIEEQLAPAVRPASDAGGP